jgi:hypothetical protein
MRCQVVLYVNRLKSKAAAQGTERAHPAERSMLLGVVNVAALVSHIGPVVDSYGV